MKDRRIPILNIYYLLCYAWSHVEERDVVRLHEITSLHRIHDLLAKVLAGGTFRLLRRGIDRGYREQREDLMGIRGKLALAETVKRALLTQAQAVCDFEELSHNVLHNCILRSTLRSLLRLPDLNSEVQTEVRSAYQKLHGVRLVRLNRQLFQQVQLDRNRQIYRFLLSVCRLVHDQLRVDERTGDARFVDFSRERMAKLFEDFVIEFYRREQSDYRVNDGGRRIKWDDGGTRDDQRSKIPWMEADIILEGPMRRIILDTKYYEEALGGRFGGKLRSENLYQLLAYLRNREATVKSGPCHEGILLYPMVDRPLMVRVRLEGFTIQARTIDLGQEWRKIHADMKALIA